MAEHKQILLRDGKFIRQHIYEEDLGPQEDLLKEQVQVSTQTFVPQVALLDLPSEDLIMERIGAEDPGAYIQIPMHMSRMDNVIMLGWRMPYYPINAWFAPTNLNYLWDNLYYGGNTDGLEAPENSLMMLEEEEDSPFAIKAKSFIKYPGLWFAMAVHLTNEMPRFREVDLYALTHYDGKWYAPWLPNIFNTGRMCWGEARTNIRGESLLECAVVAMDQLINTTTTPHLQKAKSMLYQLFDEDFNHIGKFWSTDPKVILSGREVNTRCMHVLEEAAKHGL